jgi:DNA-binding transcriptional LysR family regulator
MTALRAAALAGVGIVQLPTLVVCDQLAQGALVKLIPDWAPRREIIHAVFSSRRGQMPAVRALLDYLVERYQAMDED